MFKERKKILYLGDGIAKIEKKLVGWKRILLSPGGKFALTKHVCQRVLIQIFAAFDTPKAVTQRIEADRLQAWR